jgi:hypothetical protein
MLQNDALDPPGLPLKTTTRPTPRRLVPPGLPALQERITRWVSELAVQPGFAPASLPEFSAQSAKAAPYRAAQVMLRLLAEKITPDLAPELMELLGGPALTPLELAASQPVRQELNNLPENALDSWSLAGLHLWSAEEGRAARKRSGSYYTSPGLARYITGKTLTAELAGRPILDPACGGGVFLLAALERLAQLEPQADPLKLILERLYGLDLNSVAVLQTRLVIIKRLVEINPKAVEPALIIGLAAQIRPGNALVGPVGLSATAPGSEGRRALYQALRAGDSRLALQEYYRFEAGLAHRQAALKAEIAVLPIFNAPQDGHKLAALNPFDWLSAFPEVFSGSQAGFGAVLGNPPYVGFNDYSGVEKAYFAQVYPEVYNLKSDLLYYFIRRGVELLGPGGRLGLVTSRFWKEAAFAAPLRRWLLAETSLLGLEDLGGEQHFAGAEVDVCLLFAARQPARSGHAFGFRFAGQTETFLQSALSGQAPWTWLRQLPPERLLLAEIAERSCRLGEIALCRTGVQTGLDRAFFVEAATAGKLEPALLKRVIKNRDIGPGQLDWGGQWLIYPPPGFEPREFPALLAYLQAYRPALERRRRYTKAFPFYELQWPREAAVFEAAAKLVTPFKAPRNTFAVDRQGLYFSTDVISVVFPGEQGAQGRTAGGMGWPLEELAANFLNSRLSTFQFRSYGKPMGGGQWDYYANPVKKLAFPLAALPSATNVHPDPLLTQLAQPGLCQSEIDELVSALYELSPEQRDTLNGER